MTLSQLGQVLLAMANAAEERAEYYQSRQANGGKPAPQATAVAWTLRRVFSAGAHECVKLEREEIIREQQIREQTRMDGESQRRPEDSDQTQA